MESGPIQAILTFFSDVFTAIVDFLGWVDDMADIILDLEIAETGLVEIIGLYRYVVGEALWLASVSALYIGVVMLAVKMIPLIVSLWKKFSPVHGG